MIKCFTCKYRDPNGYNFCPDILNIVILNLTYSTIFHGFHEIELYTIIRNKFIPPVSNNFEKNWKIFLGDCFIILRLSLIKPNELLDNLNKINPAIQLAIETSDTQLPFLDIMINKEGKKIFIDIY